jgi:beta-glucosidase-like glycosyl hydrolase
MGATFDRELWRDIGKVIGSEARGLNNMKVLWFGFGSALFRLW